MANATILTEDDLRSCVELDLETLTAVEDAFRALAADAGVAPPSLSMALNERNGAVDFEAAFVPGLDSVAVKVNPSLLASPAHPQPSPDGLMILLDAENGAVRAVLLDNGYLTDVAAAAAGAVAAKHLAPAEIRTAGVIGAGVQADLQIRALKEVRDFSELVVWARESGKSEAYALNMRKTLDISVRVAHTPADVVHKADVLVTTTPAAKPIIRHDWLRPGLHITAMGANTPGKNELDPRILADADLFVVDYNDRSRTKGEMRAAIDNGLLDEDFRAPELSEIIGGASPGRESDDAVTVCDLTGTGVQDTAIAAFALRIATECGVGLELDN